MLLAAMEEDDISVRKLAKLAGVSPTIIQEMRSGSRDNFNTKSFFKVLKGLGYNLLLERNGHIFSVDLSNTNHNFCTYNSLLRAFHIELSTSPLIVNKYIPLISYFLTRAILSLTDCASRKQTYRCSRGVL